MTYQDVAVLCSVVESASSRSDAVRLSQPGLGVRQRAGCRRDLVLDRECDAAVLKGQDRYETKDVMLFLLTMIERHNPGGITDALASLEELHRRGLPEPAPGIRTVFWKPPARSAASGPAGHEA